MLHNEYDPAWTQMLEIETEVNSCNILASRQTHDISNAAAIDTGTRQICLYTHGQQLKACYCTSLNFHLDLLIKMKQTVLLMDSINWPFVCRY